MKELFKALAAFQQDVPVIHKGTQGYGYSYSSLPEIFEVINPLLKKHGLGFYQAVTAEGLKTTVFHSESGETIESLTPMKDGVSLKGMNDFQVLGSQITYLRRYSLSSMLGLVTDKDTDAAGEQKKPAPPQPPAPRKIKEGGTPPKPKAKVKVTKDFPSFDQMKQAVKDGGYTIEELNKNYEFDTYTSNILNSYEAEAKREKRGKWASDKNKS